jgi:hypothetical protein
MFHHFFLERILAFNTSTISHVESQQQRAVAKELQHHATVSSNWVARQHTCLNRKQIHAQKYVLGLSVLLPRQWLFSCLQKHTRPLSIGKLINRQHWEYKIPVYKASFNTKSD